MLALVSEGIKMHVPKVLCMCSVARSCFFAAPWTVACQAPLSMGFPRQKYWLPCPPPGNLPEAGIKPTSLSYVSYIGRQVLYQ